MRLLAHAPQAFSDHSHLIIDEVGFAGGGRVCTSAQGGGRGAAAFSAIQHTQKAFSTLPPLPYNTLTN